VIIPEYNAIAKGPNTAVILYRSVFGWLVSALFGVACMFVTRHFDFPNIFAAQTTMGILGLTGSLSHTLIIKTAGGRVTFERSLSLSVIWALSCMGGVTPLFLTFGTPSKMAVLAFYSFAIFGALGGIATALAMRAFFDKASSHDIIPSVVSWSLSFGLAAIAGEIIGGGLQIFLPKWIAWCFAFGALALIVGSGSGYSIVLFLKPERKVKRVFERSKFKYEAFSKETNRRYIGVLILLTVPFYLNDFANIFVKDWRLWILIDYTTVKIFIFLIVFWLIRSKRMHPYEFGLTAQQAFPFMIVFVIGTLVGTFIDQNGYMILNRLPGYTALKGMPELEISLWKWIDLTAGLLMVAISEELVFRGYLKTFLSRYTQNSVFIIGISAVAFGFIHWSGGLHQVIVTSAIGTVFMILYLRTHSLPAIILAHFAVNFIDFADVIPKTIFKFV